MRVVIVVAAVVLGAALSWRTGLQVRAHGARHPVLRGSLIGLGFGVYMALADAIVFRGQIPPVQVAIVTDIPAWQRIAVFVPLVLVDELVYRLCMVPLVASILAAGGWRADGTPTENTFRAAIVAVAITYVLVHFRLLTGGVLTPATAAREIALHVAAGSLWGHLFWRNGLTTALAAHMSAHVSLQIVLGLMLR